MTQVVALRDGFYGEYRKAGDIFQVAEESKISDRWMAVEGSQKYIDYTRAKGDRKQEKDGITGERIAAGGVAEQLAVSLEENRQLKDQIAELQGELEVIKIMKGEQAPVEPQTPADEGGDDEGEDTKATETETVVRRRRRK